MSLISAQHENFVDFYELLGMEHDASTIQLRSRINEMFGEAQANRDHRNLEKREEYQALLHWLPICRAVLLHEARRVKYDSYISAPRGQTLADFNAFIGGLTGAADVLPGADAPLGVKSRAKSSEVASRPAPAAPYVAAVANGVSIASPNLTPLPITPLPPAPTKTVDEPKPAKPLPTALTNPVLREELMGLISSAVGVTTIFLVYILARAVLHLDYIICLLPSLLIGGLVWAGLSKILAAKTSAS